MLERIDGWGDRLSFGLESRNKGNERFNIFSFLQLNYLLSISVKIVAQTL